MNKYKTISFRDLLCLSYIGATPALVAYVPGKIVANTGSAVWVAGLLGFVPMYLYFIFLSFFFKNRAEGEGLGEMFIRAAGGFWGRIAVLLMSGWQIFYAAITCANGAIKFSSAIFPMTDPIMFLVIMMLACLVPAFGKARTLTRAAGRAAILLAVITVATLLVAVFGIDIRTLVPVRLSDTLPVLTSSMWGLRIMGIYCVTLFLLCEVPLSDKKKTRGHYFILCASSTSIFTLICICVQGYFGKELSGKLSMPVLSMLRMLKLFDAVERFEALIISVWTFADFFLISSMVLITSKNLRLVFNCPLPPEVRGKRLPLFREGRWTVWVSFAAAFGTSVYMYYLPQGSLDFLRSTITGAVIFAIILGVIPIVFIIGKIRKRI